MKLLTEYVLITFFFLLKRKKKANRNPWRLLYTRGMVLVLFHIFDWFAISGTVKAL